VHHQAIDGQADTHPWDDTAPRSVKPPFEVDPNPDGTIDDRGVGKLKPDGTFGADIFTDVISSVAVSRPLQAIDDVATTAIGTPVSIPVLANDRGPNGATLSVSGSPAGRWTVRFDTNVASYIPGNGFIGTDRFTYQVSDGLGDSAAATVTVTVISPSTDHPPTAVNDSAATTVSNAVAISVLANDTDRIIMMCSPSPVSPNRPTVWSLFRTTWRFTRQRATSSARTCYIHD